MKSLSIARPKEKLAEALDQALAIDPTVLFVFAAPSLFRDPAAAQMLSTRLKGRQAIGCSTSGEIANEGALDESVSILSIQFDTVKARSVCVDLPKQDESFAVGRDLGEQFRAPDLAAIFIFGPGSEVNGSALVDGVMSGAGSKIFLGGGLAADGLDFKETYTLCGEAIHAHALVGIALYGQDLLLSNGSEGGWRPFGPARKVTKADHNVLLELDGKPALRLYKQYLGERARELPASGLSYPFAVLRPDRTTSGMIRSTLAIDPVREALILAGDVKEGVQVCLMHADTDALTQGAAQAAAEALRTHPGGEQESGCVMAVSCVGRKYVYGFDVDEEVEAVVDSFLPNTPVCGFYSYGEIFTNMATGVPEFRNQTVTIIYMTERRRAAP